MSELTGTNRDRVVRGDIEGLRALAVMSVLLNHAFPKALPGGFVGVDIFFVISGYLIGKHLLQDIEANRFSFIQFYAKRARRIFPALALLLFCIFGAGWFVLSGPEFLNLGKHIAASTLFANNVLLWSETGYFDATALDKPLLHLWSLGIEEQFYLLVPGLLWLGTSGTTGSIRWVGRFAVLSLIATILLSNFDYPASFYLLHTRFWELAAGVGWAQAELRLFRNASHVPPDLAVPKGDVRELLLWSAVLGLSAVVVLGASDQRMMRHPFADDGGLLVAIGLAVSTACLAYQLLRPTCALRLISSVSAARERIASSASAIGVVLICASIATFSTTEWPGARTLVPVLGAVLFIAATPTAAVNRALGSKPFAFIGGISYPLYLWHWPAIVFFKMLVPDSTATEISIPLIAAFALAWLTKVLIEDPVRFGRLGSIKFPRPTLWPVLSSLAVAALLGSWIANSDGLSSRFPPRLRAIAEWSEENPDINWRVGTCYFYTTAKADFSSECTPEKRSGVPRVLLWGDSHAAHLYPGLADMQRNTRFDIVQWTAAGCPPTVEPLTDEPPTCRMRRESAWARLRQLDPDIVLLGGGWGRYFQLEESESQILKLLADTVNRLKVIGIRRIVIFGPGPIYQTTLPNDLFRFMAARRMQEIPPRFGRIPDSLWHLDAALRKQAEVEKVQYVSILNFFCNGSGCLTIGDKALPRPDLLYRDKDHLTVTGSKMLIAHSNLHIS
ncbi:MAG TPA: acyltransferase family protein [Rhizomicrobium sp.]|nr:acyltransferase family protein [Rhizomicrobium sp.]